MFSIVYSECPHLFATEPQKGQGGKKQDAASVFRVTSSCFFVCVSSFFLTHSAGKVGFGALVRWVGEHCGGIAIFHQLAQVHKH